MGVLVVVRSRTGKDGGWSQTSLGISSEKKLKRSGLKSAIATVVRPGFEGASGGGALQENEPWALGSYKLLIVYWVLVSQRVETKSLASLMHSRTPG